MPNMHLINNLIIEVDEETKKRLAWNPPIGRVIEAGIARAADPEVRKRYSTADQSGKNLFAP